MGRERGGGQEGVLVILHAVVMRPLITHSYRAGTEHVKFSSNQTLKSPSEGGRLNYLTKLRDMKIQAALCACSVV